MKRNMMRYTWEHTPGTHTHTHTHAAIVTYAKVDSIVSHAVRYRISGRINSSTQSMKLIEISTNAIACKKQCMTCTSTALCNAR